MRRDVVLRTLTPGDLMLLKCQNGDAPPGVYVILNIHGKTVQLGQLTFTDAFPCYKFGLRVMRSLEEMEAFRPSDYHFDLPDGKKNPFLIPEGRTSPGETTMRRLEPGDMLLLHQPHGDAPAGVYVVLKVEGEQVQLAQVQPDRQTKSLFSGLLLKRTLSETEVFELSKYHFDLLIGDE